MKPRNFNKDLTTFEEFLDECYGPIDSLKRTEFEIRAKARDW